MKTRRPISTISYLTEDFLVSKLSEALDNNDIIFWCYIRHKPDNDFTKEHYHVYVDPGRQIDTFSFNKKFVEIDPNNEKPLKCLEWITSNFDNWYFYVLHDKDYLKLKGMERKFHYNISDLWFSDVDEFDNKVSMIDRSRIVGIKQIIEAANELMPLKQAIEQNIIPASRFNQYINLFRAVKSDKLASIKDPMEKYNKEVL